jgi:quercetin dioxygenase-like cupin family protein
MLPEKGEETMSEHIQHLAEIPTYAPPGHSGTVNRRLVTGDFNGAFEMVLGEIAPGGVADRHAHDREHQCIYILEGEAEVQLGRDPKRRCGPGTIIRIPPGFDHEVTALGSTTLRLIVLYSPPLPKRDDRPMP